MKSYNQKNFHKYTFCLWQEIPFTEIQSLFINHKSKSEANTSLPQKVFTEFQTTGEELQTAVGDYNHSKITKINK